jgi:GAF domain-containing protein/anti-sigma regulatory factor (Ser/Thr protein kinase)
MSPEKSTIGGDQAVEELRRELAEAREQQGTTAEILRVISSSPMDLQGVFATIARNAARLCDAYDAVIHRVDGDLLPVVAHHGPISVPSTLPLRAGFFAGRAAIDQRTIHVADVQAATDKYPEGSDRGRVLGFRTILAVPLIRTGKAIGVISIRRRDVRAFTDRQIDLLKTFADQAVIAIENTRLFEAEQESKRELQESLEYQTAISDVLNVISRSPNELQPVLEVIVKTAVRLCRSTYGHVRLLRDDGAYQIAAHQIADPELLALLLENPFRPGRDSVAGRAALEGVTVHVPDIAADPLISGFQRRISDKVRTAFAVPLKRNGAVVGLISVFHNEVRPFTQQQIDLVTTFANQAVIAMNNVHLFEAEQASKRELQESLEYQMATSDVLGVISRSPTDMRPVFGTIAKSAALLCRARFCHVFRFDGELIHFADSHGLTPEAAEIIRREYPMRPSRATISSRTILSGTVEQIPDMDADPGYQHARIARAAGYGSLVAAPMLKNGLPVGAIVVGRSELGRFAERQIELLKTFADQAVIAIENTRLFEEVQARTRELSEALEQQTATSEVLQIISSSPGNLKPVFDAMLANAMRICEARFGYLLLQDDDGESFHLAYSHDGEVLEQGSIRPGPSTGLGRVVRTKQVVHIPDLTADPAYSEGDPLRIATIERAGARTLLAVPMLKDNRLVGAIIIYRQEMRPFTDKQVDVVSNFANQAVIAIENTRLFEEVQARSRELARSVQELQALGDVGRAVSSTLDLKVVLKTIVDRAVDLSGTDGGSIFYYHQRAARFELGETTGLDEEVVARFRKLDISTGQTGLGEAIAQRQPLQLPDILNRPSNPLRDAAIEAGLRAALIVPLLGSEGPLGALVLQRRQPGEFPAAVVTLMQAFADQSAIALENARLFDEIAQKSRELEIASQHKSQFVANMSHELRTPLAAILGYAELIQEGFYEPQGPKSLDALTRIRSNGKHLLGLINTVLDIAKIESGQFTLNMAEYAIESVVETVRSATESLAQNKKLVLKTEMAKPLPVGLGDEQRLTQVLLNLVGNAIKFTDTGEVRVIAQAVNGHFNVSVTDTGPGIPPEEQSRIFDQFHQVDSSLTKAKGGTGLGLAIAKQIVEMHGGRIWVESTLGKGSTFQMEIPTRAATR